MPFINAYTPATVPLIGPDAPASGMINAPGAYLSQGDMNTLSNSYIAPDTQTSVYANPTISQDRCNAIKCGANASVAELYACSQQYGAGTWDLCGDSRCSPYRGSVCMSPLAPQVIPSATSPLDAPVAPITYAEINGVAPQAVPVIVSSIEVVTVCDPFDKWISDNQMLVAAALVLGYLSAWGRGK